MTVKGDDIIKSCSYCWSTHAFGIRLEEHGDGKLQCPHCKNFYGVENGLLKRI